MCELVFAAGSRHILDYLLAIPGDQIGAVDADGRQVIRQDHGYRLDAESLGVYLALTRHMNSDSESWPSYSRISHYLNIDDRNNNTVRRRMRELERIGLIEDTGRLSRPGGTRVWRIHPPWAPRQTQTAAEGPTQTTLPLDEPPAAPPASTKPERRQRKAKNESETATPAPKRRRKTDDTPKHSEAARALVAHIRQTLPEPPACGWPRWMKENLQAAETLLQNRTLEDAIRCWDWARQDEFWASRIANVKGLQNDTLWAQFRRNHARPQRQNPAPQPLPEPDSTVLELQGVLRQQQQYWKGA